MFMMHDENNATSNDKLVIVTDFLNKNEHKGSYKRPSETRRST